MEDKEIGELWGELHSPMRKFPDVDRNVKIALIRKLVEERAKNKRLQKRAEDCGPPHHIYVKGEPRIDRSVHEDVLALRDFGIDPATWTHGDDKK